MKQTTNYINGTILKIQAREVIIGVYTMTRRIKFDGGVPCNVTYQKLTSHQKDFSRHGDRERHDKNFRVVSADHINAMETRNYLQAKQYQRDLDIIADAFAWLKDC